jgi:hypothetical protein
VKHSIGVTAAAMLCLVAASSQAADTKTADSLFGKVAVSEQKMSEMRGGAAISENAINAGNSCDYCTINGTASVSGNAFGQAAGLITVIQNTGANMILQNSTVVNVSIH